MPRGTIDWKSTESYTRLLAAMVAAQDMKLNYKKIADMYGEGATYDAIEGRFRIIKKEAAKLKEEIDTGARPEAPARGGQGTPRKPRSPQKSTDGVLSGRISKSVNSTPTKKRPTKKDLLESSASSSTNDESSGLTPTDSISYLQPDSFTTFGSTEYSFSPFDSFVQNWDDEHIA